MGKQTDVVVIGAGQAGLSAAYFLRRAGFRNGTGFVVLDHGERPGGAWQYRWPSLVLGKVHGIHDLPNLSFGTPAVPFVTNPTAATAEMGFYKQIGCGPSPPTFGRIGNLRRPASEVVSEYFARYERVFDLPVRRPVDVVSVSDTGGGALLVESPAESWTARAVINATGTWDRPFWPRYPGQESFAGRQLHTADYRGPEEFRGRHVVVVGGGASAVQALLEIAELAADTTWVTRRPPVFRDEEFTPEYGRAVVAEVDRRVREGLPPESVVSVTGLMLTPEVRRARERGILDRRPMFDRIEPGGVVWPDGTRRRADMILWATGFRAALDHLAPLHLRAPGGGIRMDGTRVVADPRLHLVGYGPSASTIGATRAGRAAVREIRQLLETSSTGLGLTA